MKKRGVAGILTTVLIIIISFAAVVVLYNVVKPLVSEKAGGIERSFERLMLSHLEVVDWTDNGDGTVDVTISAGAGEDVGTAGFTFITPTEDCYIEYEVNIQALETKTFYDVSTGGCSDITSIEIEALSVYVITIGNLNIKFENPTPFDNSYQSSDSIFIKVSAAGASNISTFIDFDGSLEAWWRMDDVSGSTVFDNSSHSNDGIAVGNAIKTDSGYLGKAFEFDGSGDYIAVASLDERYSDVNDFSVAGWFKTTGTTGSQTIVGQWLQSCTGVQGAFVGWQVLVENNVVVARTSGFYLSTLTNIIGSTPVNDGEWHYFVFVHPKWRSGKNPSSLYVDGSLEATAIDLHIGKSGCKFRIGDGSYVYNTPQKGCLKGGPFDGSIDDVMLFNRALSTDEIIGLYANKLSEYLEKNFTNLADGSHTFKAYTQDMGGGVSSTEKRQVVIIGVGDTTCESCGFFGFGCSYEDCHALGNCYYNPSIFPWKPDCMSVSNACSQITQCSDYSDEECDNDVCGIGSCQWNSSLGECVGMISIERDITSSGGTYSITLDISTSPLMDDNETIIIAEQIPDGAVIVGGSWNIEPTYNFDNILSWLFAREEIPSTITYQVSGGSPGQIRGKYGLKIAGNDVLIGGESELT